MEDIYKIFNICTCMVGSLIQEAPLFGSMEEECDYDHTLNDDSAIKIIFFEHKYLSLILKVVHKVVRSKIVLLEKTFRTCAKMWNCKVTLDVEHENIEIPSH